MQNLLPLFVIGFTAAAIPGAVQTTVFMKTVEGNITSGLRLAAGAAVMDSLYLFFACFGLTSFIDTFPILRITIGLMGVGFMFYLGMQGIHHAWINKGIDPEKRKRGGFLTGLVLVLLHVPTFLYFVGVAGAMCKGTISVFQAVSGAISLLIGAFMCFVFVALIAWIGQRFGGKNLIRALQFGSALILLIFAFKTLISLFIFS